MIVYVHIPKTGGSAVTNALRRCFGKANVLHAGSSEENAELRSASPEELGKYKAIGAHMPYGSLREVCGDALYFTILREPFKRIMSLYRHIDRTENHPQHALVKSHGIDGWLDYLEDNPEKLWLEHQCYYFGSPAYIGEIAPIPDDLLIGDYSCLQQSLDTFLAKRGVTAPELLQVNVAPTEQPLPEKVPEDRIRDLFAEDFRIYEERANLMAIPVTAA
ncbi:MAG: sulfotransferase family 2 domain-containing protein [Methyloligella sp. ZOD6]